MTRLFAGVMLLAGAATFAVQAAQAPPRDAPVVPRDTATLSGMVVNDEDPAQPVRRAILTLAGQSLRPSRSAITDDEGRFTFLGLPAGQFTLTVSRRAFVTSMYGAKRPGRPGTAITVADGARLSDITVKIWRGAVVAGTLRDESGVPVTGVEVRAVPARAPGTLPSLSNNGATTNELGQFRIFGLEPGTYVVMAKPASGAQSANLALTDAETEAALEALRKRSAGALTTGGTPPAPPVPPPSQPPFDYAPVFFPGTPVLAQATVITLASGQTQDGIDFALQRVPTTVIEGTITRPDGTPAAGASLQLILRRASGPFSAVGRLELTATAATDGAFRIAQVLPGQYDLVVRAPADVRAPGVRPGYIAPPTTPQLFAVSAVATAGSDIRGLGLRVGPGTPIRGRIVFESPTKAAPKNLGRIAITLMPDNILPLPTTGTYPGDQLRMPEPALVRADGTFEFAGVAPGRYQVLVGSAPESWQPRSATVGGLDVLDGLLDVPSGGDISMIVTFDDMQTNLSGRLETAAGEPVSDVFVIAFSVDRSTWGVLSRRVKAIRPARDGTFAFTGLPAGDYHLSAVTDADPEDWESSAFLEQIVPASVKITLVAGRSVVQNLRMGR